MVLAFTLFNLQAAAAEFEVIAPKVCQEYLAFVDNDWICAQTFGQAPLDYYVCIMMQEGTRSSFNF